MHDYELDMTAHKMKYEFMDPVKVNDSLYSGTWNGGQMLEFVNSLPDCPCVILVENHRDSNEIYEFARNWRPEYNINYVRFEEYRNVKDLTYRYLGPIYVFHTVLKLVEDQFIQDINLGKPPRRIVHYDRYYTDSFKF